MDAFSKIKSQKAWYDLMNSEMRPADIPVTPQLTYRKDWVNWGHWFGTGTISTSQRQFRSFEDAKTFVQSLNLETFEEWRRYCADEFTEKPKLARRHPRKPPKNLSKRVDRLGEF